MGIHDFPDITCSHILILYLVEHLKTSMLSFALWGSEGA